MSPNSSSLDADPSLSILFGWDQCSDILFGSDGSDEVCMPNRSLCCGKEIPTSHQSLGKDWCCVGNDPIDNYYSLDQPSVCEKHSVPYTSIAQDSIEACSACPNSCVTGTPASSEVLFCYMQHDDPEERAEAVHDEESPNPSSTPQSPSTESILATKGIATRNGANLSTPAILDSPIPQAALTSGTAGNASENALPKPPSSVTNSKRDVGAEIYSKASPDHGCCCGKVPAFRILVGLGIYLPPEAAAIKTALWGSHGSPWAAAAEETITVVSDLPESFYCAHPELPAETVDEVLAEYVDSQLVDLPAAKLG